MPDVFPALVLLGTQASARQIQNLASLNKAVRLALDNDEAGVARTAASNRLLGNTVRTQMYLVPPGYKDVGEMSGKVVRW